MLINHVGLRMSQSIKNGYKALFLLVSVACSSQLLYGSTETFTYYLNIKDFAKSFIKIPTSNVSSDSTTLASSYLAGRAPIYNEKNKKAGICSASFLNMKTSYGVFTDISNFISTNDGLIVTWFTPTTLINLELDSIIHSMVTECIVKVTTKVGASVFYGKTYTLVVSSDDQKIYFEFTRKC